MNATRRYDADLSHCCVALSARRDPNGNWSSSRHICCCPHNITVTTWRPTWWSSSVGASESSNSALAEPSVLLGALTDGPFQGNGTGPAAFQPLGICESCGRSFPESGNNGPFQVFFCFGLARACVSQAFQAQGPGTRQRADDTAATRCVQGTGGGRSGRPVFHHQMSVRRSQGLALA